MTRIRVFIATTEGPVAVQKITAEEPDVPSVVCRDGTTEVLAISPDYTRFVDRGTGLVAKLTGHGAYRLDLDRPVDGGRSWQLPVLLAHLLDMDRRLVGPCEPADLVILATGEVDRAQRVRAVGRIVEKLAAAQKLIAECKQDGPPLVFLLPSDDWGPDLRDGLGSEDSSGSIRICTWDNVQHPGTLKTPEQQEEVPLERGATDDMRQGREARRWRGSRVIGTFLVLAVVSGIAAGAAWWTGPRQWEALRRAGEYAALDRSLRQAFIPALADRYRVGLLEKAPPAKALQFTVEEHRTAHGQPCNRRRFGRTDPVGQAETMQTPAQMREPDMFHSEQRASLCRAVYRVTNMGDRLFYVYFAVLPLLRDAAGDEVTIAPLHEAVTLPSNTSLALDVSLAGLHGAPAGAHLLALAVPSPLPELRRTFHATILDGEAPAAHEAELLELDALSALGMTVRRGNHIILD